jgi:hypothetical protein
MHAVPCIPQIHVPSQISVPPSDYGVRDTYLILEAREIMGGNFCTWGTIRAESLSMYLLTYLHTPLTMLLDFGKCGLLRRVS